MDCGFMFLLRASIVIVGLNPILMRLESRPPRFLIDQA